MYIFAAILLLVQEVDQPRRSVMAMCHLLSGQHGLRKPYKPSRDIKCFLIFFQLVVTCLPLTLGRKGQRDEAGLSNIFRE
jgi:ABC-type transport system involved in cytochrome c biogenesis permease component